MNSNNVSEKKSLPWKKIIIGVVVVLVVIIIIGALAGGHGTSGPAMTFKTVGTKGMDVFIVLVSPSADAISPQDLANRLRADWENQEISVQESWGTAHVSNIKTVWVFDNEASAQLYITDWDTLLTMTTQQGAAFDAQVNPHFIAEYEENTNTGLNDVLFFSLDTAHNVTQTIKF